MTLYHVIYLQNSDEQAEMYVLASTQPNAVAAVQANDGSYASITSLETMAQNVVVGS